MDIAETKASLTPSVLDYRDGGQSPVPLIVPALEVHDLTVSYHRKPVLWNVDLAVPPGKLVGIIGPNGRRANVVQGLVIPSLAQSLQAVVARDCSGTAPMCCSDGSAGQTVISVFDNDGDCEITIDEVRDDGLITSIFAPDLDLYNGAIHQPNVDGVNDAVSIGVGFTAVNGFFITPIPI